MKLLFSYKALWIVLLLSLGFINMSFSSKEKTPTIVNHVDLVVVDEESNFNQLGPTAAVRHAVAYTRAVVQNTRVLIQDLQVQEMLNVGLGRVDTPGDTYSHEVSEEERNLRIAMLD